MNEIYIVIYCFEYEGYGCLQAFENKEEAEAFKNECSQMLESKPEWQPNIDDDNSYSSYEALIEVWSKNHPHKDTYNQLCDSYGIITVPFKGLNQ